MESEADRDETRPALSRPQIILAILACTVVPAWLLVAALRASPEPLAAPLFVAFSVTLLRGAAVAARWVGLGPGRPPDRTIWGIFLVAMLTLAPFAAFDRLDAISVAPLIPYFAVQTIYWRFTGFLGEREAVGERGISSQFGLQDALVALALFCIVAAGARTGIDLRDFRASFELAFVFVASCVTILFAGFIPFLCDLGMRAAIRSRSSRGRRAGIMIVALPTIVAIVGVFGISVERWNADFVVTAFGFIVAYLAYAAFQETVLAVAGIVAVDPTTEVPAPSRPPRSDPR